MALQAAFDSAVIEDDAAEMLRISEEIAQVARDSQEARLSASLNASLALWFLGRTGEALAAARRAWLESHERVLPMLILAAGSMRASRLIWLRPLVAARAEAVAADCRGCAGEMNLRAAETCARLGRVDQAENALRAWDSDGRPAEPGDQLWRKHAGALITIASQDPATGIAELETVVSERRRRGLVASLLWARLDLATALSGRDDGRAADELRQAGVEAETAGAETEQRLAGARLRRLGGHTRRRGRAASGDAALG